MYMRDYEYEFYVLFPLELMLYGYKVDFKRINVC